MMQMIKRIFATVLIFFIIIALHSPIYHQHVERNHLLEPLQHTHDISRHSPSDYSVILRGSSTSMAGLSVDFNHTYYYSHFGKNVLRIRRIENNQVQASVLYVINTFDNLSTQLLALKKHSYNQYKSKNYSNNSAKTSSGLSPPIYSA